MSQTNAADVQPLTEDAFLADRMAFWKFFTGGTKFVAIGIAVLLILLAIFLG